MPILSRPALLIASLTLPLAATFPGQAFAAAEHAPDGSPSSALQEAPLENDDLVPVALGTVGAIAAVGVVAAAGYLYRRQMGATAHYDDGFTPTDPRDRATH